MTNVRMMGLGLAVALAVAAGSAVAAPARTNVLFLIVDDLTATLGCYGDRDARTPNMDGLAARGMRFDQAFTQFALCNPSRASFLTGCYPERTRVYDLTTSFRDAMPDAVTLPQLFKNAGYAAGRIGKVFHVPDPKTKLDVEIGASLQKDGTILDEAKLAERSEGDLSDPPRKSGREGNLYNRCYAPSPHPDRDFTDYDIADNAIATLEQFKDKPFFLAVGFIRPHTPYVAPQRFFDLIDPKTIAMPPFYGPGGEDLALMPKAALRPNNNVFRFAAPSPTEAREARRAYLASTAFVDAQVGRVLAKLKELGLEDSTAVLLTGDHGYQLGEHGLWAKQTLFEEGTRVPMLVAAPGVKPGVCSQLVEQVDIYPTLAGLAGLATPTNVQGVTMQPFLADPSAKGRPAVFSTMLSTHTKLIGRSARTDRFRYIEWDDGRGGNQLYDHADDPHELANLAAQPTQADRVGRLRARLADHVKRVESASTAAVASTPTNVPPVGTSRPNVLLIVADDLGYGDLAAYGCKDFATPNLDALAKAGVRFTDGYVPAPVCGPSRAGLLTGRHPCRILPYEGNPPPGSDTGLPTGLPTLADRFKAAGYRTAALGKWHLGESPAHHPMSRGFDEFFGFLSGMHSYVKAVDPQWGPIMRGREPAELKDYLTFALADEACGFVSRPSKDPFFLYLAFNAPHVPLEAPEEYLAKTGHLADPMRRANAAMILALDDAVGRVLAALRESGREQETLVVFLSDNGAALIKGSAENGGSNAPLRGSKAQLWEGGIRVPFFARWPGHIPAGGTIETPVSALDLYPTLLAAAGVKAQPDWQLDGLDLLPWLEGRGTPPDRGRMYWKFGSRQLAVRDGDMKLVQVNTDKGLFNLHEDIAEATDRTEKRPVLVRQLQAAWKAWDAGNAPVRPVPRRESATAPAAATNAPASASNAVPNIVLVLADDLGYGDVSCYNPEAKFRTPNVDRLASEGTRFTDAHTPTSVCTPTRYGILTGRHCWRTRLQRGVLNEYDSSLIAPGRLTLPGLLAAHGYDTACIGKWHLGFDWELAGQDRTLFEFGYRKGAPVAATEAHLAAWRAVFSRPLAGGPIDHGFMSYFGPDVPNMPPYGFIRGNRMVEVPTVLKQAGDISDTGNTTTTGAAGPMVAGWAFDRILPSLVRESVDYIGRRAADRKSFFLYFSLTSPHFPVVPSPAFLGKSGVGPLADFILESDDALGQVMDALDRHGLAANTILVFTSDNGPAHNSRAPLDKAGHHGSGPLRGAKASIYEGGHRVPFVVRWPGRTPAGAVSDELICQTAFLATCADLVGATLPDDAGEDSRSILPLLRGEKPAAPTHPYVLHNPGAPVFAIRQGPWKLIAMPDGKDELYDLSKDLGETANAISSAPERAAEMLKMLEQGIRNGRSTPGAAQPNDVPVMLRTPGAPVNDRAQALRSAP